MADEDTTRWAAIRRMFRLQEGDPIEVLSRLLTVLVLIYVLFSVLGYTFAQGGVGFDPDVGLALVSLIVFGGLYVYYRGP